MQMMSSRNSCAMHLRLLDVFSVDNTLDIVVGIPHAPENVSTEWQRDDEHEPRDEVFSQVGSLNVSHVANRMGSLDLP